MARGSRFVFLDALRGVAALAVVCYHLYVFSGLRAPLASVLPRWVDAALAGGHVGVAIFFVLSGFVIAHSIGADRITPRYAARFAIRRSLRLDPPYWITLALASVLLVLLHRAPTAGQVVAHIVYAQQVAGYPQIVSVFWTLSYEIQFYLVLIGLAALAQRWRIGIDVVVWPLLIVSLWYLATNRFAGGIFIDRWYAFALGVVTAQLIAGTLSRGRWLAMLLSAVVATAIGARSSADDAGIATMLTTCVIAGVGLAGQLTTWSGGRVLQYLGRISYSLYLVHFIGSALAKFGGARHPETLQAIGWFAASLVASIVLADLFYRVVERPSQQFSRSARWAQLEPIPPAVAVRRSA